MRCAEKVAAAYRLGVADAREVALKEGHGDGCVTPYLLIDGCRCGLGGAVRAIDTLRGA